MRKLLLLLSSLILLSGCSLQKIALNTTTGLFSYGIEAIYAEPDLEIAETAVASNLKLLEGFHRADPQNETLLQILTQG
ncbi:MAG: lipoprotein, partial [Aliifodinibius sp.]|nr:lipoprotein [Fodinibius sp.]NIV16455.1 lipoprotein [Fodinibius sp.]NIY30413.1 lipoprotein [Fodinibius sp.]